MEFTCESVVTTWTLIEPANKAQGQTRVGSMRRINLKDTAKNADFKNGREDFKMARFLLEYIT